MKLTGATSHFRPWSRRERDALRARYLTDGPVVLARVLHRTRGAVMHEAERARVLRRRRWTAAVDRALVMLWGEFTVTRIARKLSRTPLTVYFRARKLELRCGAPQGFEYLSHAARRVGFDAVTLRRILRWAGVGLRQAMSRPDATGRRRHFFVDPFDVDHAIEAWHATETVQGAARRLGMCDETLRKWLLDARRDGDDGVPEKPSGAKQHWRVPSTAIERVVAERLAKFGNRRAA